MELFACLLHDELCESGSWAAQQSNKKRDVPSLPCRGSLGQPSVSCPAWSSASQAAQSVETM